MKLCRINDLREKLRSSFHGRRAILSAPHRPRVRRAPDAPHHEHAMTLRILFYSFSLLAVLRLDAGMVRVTAVTDGRTIVVEREGKPLTVTLAGIELTDHAGARALLQWTLVSQWVMLEEQQGGGAFVYRSPDALFLNRELVARGMARATLANIEPPRQVPVTYLGTLRGLGVRTPASAAGSGSAPSSPTRAKPPRSRRRK